MRGSFPAIRVRKGVRALLIAAATTAVAAAVAALALAGLGAPIVKPAPSKFAHRTVIVDANGTRALPPERRDVT